MADNDILETKGLSSKLWQGLITPQTLVILLGGFASLVIFWNNQKNTTSDVDAIKKEMVTKADVSDLKSLEDRAEVQPTLSSQYWE